MWLEQGAGSLRGMGRGEGMGFLGLPTSQRDRATHATLMAFLLPLIFSILAWAKETLFPMACSWLRLSSTRWEILPPETKVTGVTGAEGCSPSSCSLLQPFCF